MSIETLKGVHWQRKVGGGALRKIENFLLQKLNSYGEA